MKTMVNKLRKKYKKIQDDLPLPPDEKIKSLSLLLQNQIKEEENVRRYAPVKSVLSLVGAAGVVALGFLSPGGALVAKSIFDEKKKREFESWKRYNPYFLKRTIARLEQQKYVEIKESKGVKVLVLTQAGRRRILKYALDQLNVAKPKRWDGRWRMVLYDVKEPQKELRDIFRSALHNLGFYKLQESVWLYPYPCEEQITFLREYYGVGNEVLYIVANRLEDDAPYRTYFGLD